MPVSRAFRRHFLFVLIGAAGLAAAQPFSARFQEEEEIVFDAGASSRPVGHYGLGFTGKSAGACTPESGKSCVPDLQPADDYALPIPATVVRGGAGMLREEQVFQRWRALAASGGFAPRYELVLGPDHCRPDSNPARDPAAMGNWLRTIGEVLDQRVRPFALSLDSAIAAGTLAPPPPGGNLGEYIRLDLWNEPEASFSSDNNEWFFENPGQNPRFRAFLDTWNAMHRYIQAYFDTASWANSMTPPLRPLIIGPSFSGFNSRALAEFKKEVLAQNTKPDILNWHSLSKESVRNVERHIREARDMVAGTGMIVEINEWTPGSGSWPAADQLLQVEPGTALRYLAVLERNAVRGAKSCWSFDPAILPGSTHNCTNRTLNGLLTLERTPRAIWHVFAASGALPGNLAPQKVYTENQDAVAGFSASQANGMILIGKHSGNRVGFVSPFVRNIPSTLVKQGKVRVSIARIESAGLPYYPSPKTVLAPTSIAVNGSGRVVLPPQRLGPGEVLVINLSSP